MTDPEPADADSPLTPSRSLALIVPVFNEQQVIGEFYRRTRVMLDGLSKEYRSTIIFINDGSSDGTADALARLADADAGVSVITFSRNFGHQLAITAGMDHAFADAVVIIDADLQDPPEVIPRMLEKWCEGFQVVYGQRATRAGESVLKRITARAFYRILGMMTDVSIPLDTGDFRLMDQAVVRQLRRIREENRYVRGLIAWTGFRQTPLLFERDARYAGESHYPLGRMIRLAFDGITSFSEKPLRLAGQLGFLTTALSVCYILWILTSRFWSTTLVPGWSSVIVVVMFLGGVQLITIGVLGEYVGRIYRESKGRPLYIVAHRTNLKRPAKRRLLRRKGGDPDAVIS